LLAAEKELTRRGDELARRRRELPWVRIEKDHRFQTTGGEATLADPFGRRSQLLAHHFMFPGGAQVSLRATGRGAGAFGAPRATVRGRRSAFGRRAGP
jgi:predicted dithiol-disulfide oxidoreductase (DUF899 family)